jgi:hypothetical protein
LRANLDDIVKDEAMRVCALHLQYYSLQVPHLDLERQVMHERESLFDSIRLHGAMCWLCMIKDLA